MFLCYKYFQLTIRLFPSPRLPPRPAAARSPSLDFTRSRNYHPRKRLTLQFPTNVFTDYTNPGGSPDFSINPLGFSVLITSSASLVIPGNESRWVFIPYHCSLSASPPGGSPSPCLIYVRRASGRCQPTASIYNRFSHGGNRRIAVHAGAFAHSPVNFRSVLCLRCPVRKTRD